jgi:hypothetical protein
MRTGIMGSLALTSELSTRLPPKSTAAPLTREERMKAALDAMVARNRGRRIRPAALEEVRWNSK